MDFDTLKVVVVLIRIFFVLLEVLGVCVGAFAKVGDYLVFEGITVLEKLYELDQNEDIGTL